MWATIFFLLSAFFVLWLFVLAICLVIHHFYFFQDKFNSLELGLLVFPVFPITGIIGIISKAIMNKHDIEIKKTKNE